MGPSVPLPGSPAAKHRCCPGTSQTARDDAGRRADLELGVRSAARHPGSSAAEVNVKEHSRGPLRRRRCARVGWGFDVGMRAVRSPVALATVLAVALVFGVAQSASAEDYPTWHEVLDARHDTAKKSVAVARIERLLIASKAAEAAAQRLAEQRGAQYQVLRDRVDAAQDRLDEIDDQVAVRRRAATRAQHRAAGVAAQLVRGTGDDLGATVLLTGDGTDAGAAALLAKVGRLSKLTQSNADLARVAREAGNTAAATEAQAGAATAALQRLQARARTTLDVATAAASEAERRVAANRSARITLTAELRVLRSKTATTLKAFKRGVAAREAAAAEGGGPAGAVAASGWALPAAGPITDGFGYRPNPPPGGTHFHRGVDIGGACGSPIYAADAGTVVYAGPLGTYGNFIEVRHDDGLSTGYAHIRPGGIAVHPGQQVSAGTNIAFIGTTGVSSGCHLHFEVRMNEVARDPVAFLATKGVTVG